MFRRIGRKLGKAEVAPLNGLCNAFGQRSVMKRAAPWAGWSGCAVRKTKEVRGISEVISTTDIFLSRVSVGNDSLNVPGGDATVDRIDAPFNRCAARRNGAYETLVHEAGHALGIRGKLPPRFTLVVPASDPDVQINFHPTVAGSVMSYERALMLPDDPDCSPHPLDIMVIYALYQTLP